MPGPYDDIFGEDDDDFLDRHDEVTDSGGDDDEYEPERRVRRRLNPPSEVDELDDTDEENEMDDLFRADSEDGNREGSMDMVDLRLGEREVQDLGIGEARRPGTSANGNSAADHRAAWARSDPEQLARELRLAAATAAGPSRARRPIPNLSEDSDEEGRAPLATRTGRAGGWRAGPSEQRQQLRNLAAGPSGARDGVEAGSGAAAPAAAGRPRRNTVVDLTAESDEEDVVFMNQVPGRADPPVPWQVRRERIERERARNEPNRPLGARFDEAMRDLNNTLDQRARQTQDILRQDAARRRDVLSPPAAPQPPREGRIGLGGALLNHRGHRLRYQPTRPGGQAQWANPYADSGLPAGGRVENAFALMRRLIGLPYPDVAGQGQAQEGRQPVLDVQTIIAGIPKPTLPDPLPGFTSNFDLDSVHPIEIDDSENVVKTKKKAKLCCFICHSRLKLSSSYTSDDERVWTLRCGHMIDQRCLHTLSTPTTPKGLSAVAPPFVVLPVLGAPEAKTAKRKVKGKVAKEMPREYEWTCPAKGCGLAHKSVKMPEVEEWVQRAGEGALQVYM